MKKIIITLTLCAAIGAIASAQTTRQSMVTGHPDQTTTTEKNATKTSGKKTTTKTKHHGKKTTTKSSSMKNTDKSDNSMK